MTKIIVCDFYCNIALLIKLFLCLLFLCSCWRFGSAWFGSFTIFWRCFPRGESLSHTQTPFTKSEWTLKVYLYINLKIIRKCEGDGLEKKMKHSRFSLFLGEPSRWRGLETQATFLETSFYKRSDFHWSCIQITPGWKLCSLSSCVIARTSSSEQSESVRVRSSEWGGASSESGHGWTKGF